MKRFIALLLAALLLLCTSSAIDIIDLGQIGTVPDDGSEPIFGDSGSQIVRIGLYYGSSALANANLQNVTGYGGGYQVGHFSSDGQFTAVGHISEIEITMSADNTYNVELYDSYTNFSEAEAAASLYNGGFPAFDNGVYRVRIGSYSNYNNAAATAQQFGAGVSAASGSGYRIRETNTGETLFEYANGSQKLGILPRGNGIDKAQTWFKGYKYYGGFEYRLDSDGRLAVISVVGLEDYIKGVIPYEMNASWPVEALKAQALCARTYALYNLGYHKSRGFDLCNSTCCQVYYGTKSATENSDAAVEQTAGMCITHNGKMIDAVYHASNGGATENSENVWTSAFPYLRAVRDDYEALTSTTHTDWGTEITKSEITAILKSKNYACTSITHAYAEYTKAGNVGKLVFVDASGKKLTFTGESCRTILNTSAYGTVTYSQRFIFEDQSNPRITSVSELSKPDGTTPGGAGLGSAISGLLRVLTSGKTTQVTEKYGTQIPVLSSSGISYASALTTISGLDGSIDTADPSVSEVDVTSLPVPTSSGNTFIIRGAGHGHNVGMSQFGAKGMAEYGRTAEEIIKHYYTGVEITQMY